MGRSLVAAVGLLLAVTLSATGLATAAPATKPTASRCVDISPAKIKRVGDRWLLLTEELVRTKPAPDFRVQQVKWTLLSDADGTTRSVSWLAEPHLAVLQAKFAGRSLSWTNRAGQQFDNVKVELATVSDDGAWLQLNLTHRASGVAELLLVPAVLEIATGKLVVGEATTVDGSKGRHHAFRGVGQDAAGRWLWLLAHGSKVDVASDLRFDLSWLSLSTAGQQTTLGRSGPHVRSGNAGTPGNHWRWAPGHTAIAVAEYQEAPGHGSAIHILEPATGRMVEVPAPTTAYVLDFSLDGKRLLVGSNREGTLALWDWATTKQLKTAKIGGQMHRGGFAADGKRVWIAGRNAPLLAFDAATLKPSGKLAPAALFGAGTAGGLAPDVDLPTGPHPWALAWTDNANGFGPASKVCWL